MSETISLYLPSENETNLDQPDWINERLKKLDPYHIELVEKLADEHELGLTSLELATIASQGIKDRKKEDLYQHDEECDLLLHMAAAAAFETYNCAPHGYDLQRLKKLQTIRRAFMALISED